MRSIQVGATAPNLLAMVIGPVFREDDPYQTHDTIDVNSAPWNNGGDDFSISVVVVGDSPIIRSATSPEIASWSFLGAGMYKITLSDATVSDAALAGRPLLVTVKGNGFLTPTPILHQIVKHDPHSLADKDATGLIPGAAVRANGIGETSFQTGSISARVLAAAAITFEKFADGCHRAAHFLAGWFTSAGMAADTDAYTASVRYVPDGATGEYTVVLRRNGRVVPFSSLVGTPTITVYPRSGAAPILNAQTLTRIGTSNNWRHDEANPAKLLAADETYLADLAFNNGAAQTVESVPITLLSA